MEMKRIELIPEDEYPHIPQSEDILWREGYHFNGYDPLNKTGITISMGIRPLIGKKNDFVMIHVQDIFLFLNRRHLEGDALHLGSLRMEPVVPFEKWRIWMKDSFQKTRDGEFLDIFEEVEFDLHFESRIPPCGHSVERFSLDKGKRYEQPGFLRGRMRIGDRTLDFEGEGIRDHSWEIRNLSKWGKWYGMMGWFESGKAVKFVFITIGNKIFCEGWYRTKDYQEVINAWMDPVLENIQKRRQIHIETSREKLEMNSHMISFITIPVGERSKMLETLVELEHGIDHGYGFLWDGRFT